jgi:hypothetical protein
MAFQYTQQLIEEALTYQQYRDHVASVLAAEPADAAGARLRYYTTKNAALMDEYDKSYSVLPELQQALASAPRTTWLVISEGWCGDAAFNVPLLNLAEKASPATLDLRLVLRDSNMELMDANLTDGGRSIPKLVVLNEALEPVGHWGPRPEPLQVLMKAWKDEGLELKELIPKVHEWYDADKTETLQQELIEMIERYTH